MIFHQQLGVILDACLMDIFSLQRWEWLTTSGQGLRLPQKHDGSSIHVGAQPGAQSGRPRALLTSSSLSTRPTSLVVTECSFRRSRP